MNPSSTWTGVSVAAVAALVLGLIGCAIGASVDAAGFFRAWLCGFLFWLGLPLAAVTLVLVHDLTGGGWMAVARPVLEAAVATMPVATLLGIPAFSGLGALYGWAHPPPSLGNTFYLNSGGFLARYVACLVLWNLIAGFALWAPRDPAGVPASPIAPALSWLSGVGLVLLALSTGFAAIDWILSVEPTFWSSVFPMATGANWFDIGLALVLLIVAVTLPADPVSRERMADLAAILLATTILWAYLEFTQFLIVWEENLKREIPWYLARLAAPWRAHLYISAGFGFAAPFLLLLWRPSKSSRRAVAASCLMVLLGHAVHTAWLVLPEFPSAPALWLQAAAMLAPGGAIVLVFCLALRWHDRLRSAAPRLGRAGHG